jgi:hypothetical protein
MANRYYGRYNWAGVSHYSNRYDRLWGDGTTYSSTSVYEEPNLRLYDEDLSDPVYDAGWSVDDSNLDNYDTLFTELSYITNLSSINNNVNKVISSNDKTITISAGITGDDIETASIIEVNSKKTYTSTIETYFDKDINDIESTSKTIEENDEFVNKKEYTDGRKSIVLTNDNEIEIFNNELLDNGYGVLFNESDVQNYVKVLLNELDLTEDDCYTVLESNINEQKLNLNSEVPDNNEFSKNTIAHTISIGRKYEDIPVSVVNGDRIDVILDENGFSYINKKWSNDTSNKNHIEKDLISVNEAIEYLEENIDNLEIEDDSVVSSINLVYKKKTFDNDTNYELIPTWEFWTTDSQIVSVDAFKGTIY